MRKYVNLPDRILLLGSPFGLAEMVLAGVVRYSEYPGGKFFMISQLVQILLNLNKCFLQQIFSHPYVFNGQENKSSNAIEISVIYVPILIHSATTRLLPGRAATTLIHIVGCDTYDIIDMGF